MEPIADIRPCYISRDVGAADVRAAETAVHYISTWPAEVWSRRVAQTVDVVRWYTIVLWDAPSGFRFAVNVLPAPETSETSEILKTLGTLVPSQAARRYVAMVDRYDEEQPGFVWTVHGGRALAAIRALFPDRAIHYRVEYLRNVQ